MNRRYTLIALTLLVAITVAALVLASGCSTASQDAPKPKLRFGSKNFTESILLGHMLGHLAHMEGIDDGFERFLGTELVYGALKAGDVAAYVEYTGTLQEQIFAGEGIHSTSALARRLEQDGLGMTQPLGFNNTYVLAMRRTRAAALGIRTISDLKAHPELKFGFSNEFMNRGDGWGPLRDRYDLPHKQVQGMDHNVAYQAIAGGHIDITDAYATDPDIATYDLTLLIDDRGHFPVYDAVILYRLDVAARFPDVIANFRRLEGKLPEAVMTRLNGAAASSNEPSRVAAEFVNTLGFDSEAKGKDVPLGELVLKATGEHLALVGVSMAFALIIALPLGVLAARNRVAGTIVLGSTGILQTIPSFALLVMLVPLMGTGFWPAIAALFVYSLLPIVRNTCTGLLGVPAELRESAAAMGLPPRARLFRVELPLAMRSILAGIKTSVVINVGTATLGAFISAGGYGGPILTGIQLKRADLMLAGAIPAALMALICQGLFELAERRLVSRGLRLRAAS
ncbi:MAG: glycine betaine ABC transporter substrate-binding protein [Planctomycetota bacterium]